MSGETNGDWPRGCDKPNLFIIGASKSGTSSLHEYLNLHPQICMSRVKEPNFFLERSAHDVHVVPEPGSERSPFELYLGLFGDLDERRYAGESSPGYTWFPHFTGVAQRLFDFNRRAKLIYLVRDPVERAVSHYWYWCLQGAETRPPLEALREHALYRDVSNYALQLRQYLEVFPREQIHVATLEDLSKQPRRTMEEIFSWLEVPFPESVSEESFSKRENETPAAVLRPRPTMTAIRNSRVFKYARYLSPAPLRRSVWALLGKQAVDRKQTDMSVPTAFLRQLLRPYAEEFESLCGRSFRQWRTVWQS